MDGPLVPTPKFPLFQAQRFSILLTEGEVQITKTQQMVFINFCFLATALPLISLEDHKGSSVILGAAGRKEPTALSSQTQGYCWSPATSRFDGSAPTTGTAAPPQPSSPPLSAPSAATQPASAPLQGGGAGPALRQARAEAFEQ